MNANERLLDDRPASEPAPSLATLLQEGLTRRVWVKMHPGIAKPARPMAHRVVPCDLNHGMPA